MFPIKHEIVYGFINRLTLPLYLALKLVIAVGSTFFLVFYHARSINRACIKTYNGGDKRPCPQYSVNGILFRGRDPSNRDQHHYILSDLFRFTPQVMSDY